MAMGQDNWSEAPSYLEERPVHISCSGAELAGSLGLQPRARGVVLIANDRGAARHRGCELALARALRERGVSTLMVDVLCAAEQTDAAVAARMRLDAMALARRIGAARRWLDGQSSLRQLPLAVVGEGGAGAAAIIEAAARPDATAALVVRAGQPLQAGLALEGCEAPVLLVVDARDQALLARNRAALAQLRGEAQLIAASSLCAAEDAACDDSAVTGSIARWLELHLSRAAAPERPGAAIARLKPAR